MTKLIVLTHQRFTRLVVLQRMGSDTGRNVTWLCRCDCGNTRVVAGIALRRGKVKSCGCRKPSISQKPPYLTKMPYGYMVLNGEIVIDEAKAHQIRMIDALDREGLTYKASAAKMTMCCPRADGRPWRLDQICSILDKRHLYQGGRRGRRVDTWPVILHPR